MTIETKFDIGDAVFFMRDNEVKASEIIGVTVEVNSKMKTEVRYYINGIGTFYGHKLYKNRNDLIKTL